MFAAFVLGLGLREDNAERLGIILRFIFNLLAASGPVDRSVL